MELFRYIQQRNWAAVSGYALFTGMMAVGYYYNVTFVQLGLIDLGERWVGMSEAQVANQMAVLALLTSAIAMLFGLGMQRWGWNHRFWLKLRLAFGVVALQTVLTAVAPFVRSQAGFLGWIVVASVALGVGVPVTFGMTVDLIPRRDRGYVAAAITALAYFAAPVFSLPWTIEALSRQMLLVMVPGILGIGVLAFVRIPFLEPLAKQHERPEFNRGRFVEPGAKGYRISRRLIGLILLMFGVYFIDSLGFLRLFETPLYMESAWQSPELGPRLFIGQMHVLAAVIAGVLYSALDTRGLFLWIFGIFALVHIEYTFDIRTADIALFASSPPSMAMPMLYAIAVSLYTVVGFAIWADVSTTSTISRNAALGVALSGWTSTFLSTAIAIRLEATGVGLEEHLNLVNALAMLFFMGLLVLSLFPRRAAADSHDAQDDLERIEE